MAHPNITVLMPVYNREQYIRGAVESILRQTFKDFEFIIVNDGSTDKTKEILEDYADKRIKIISNKKNLGQPEALNIGLNIAHGKYIAIMDSDDISLPKRLATQVRYMQKHPETGILGTAEKRIDKNGRTLEIGIFPGKQGVIKWSLILGGWCISHPSVMMRRTLIRQLSGYSKAHLLAEDYELWTRAIFHTQITNIPDVLICRRVWEKSASLFHDPKTEQKSIIDAMHSVITKLLAKNVSRKVIGHLFWLERKILLDGYQQKTELSYNIMSHCSRLEEGLSFGNFQEIKSAAGIIRKLYRGYLTVFPLNLDDEKEVTLHALKRLFMLASVAKNMSVSDKKLSTVFKL